MCFNTMELDMKMVNKLIANNGTREEAMQKVEEIYKLLEVESPVIDRILVTIREDVDAAFIDHLGPGTSAHPSDIPFPPLEMDGWMDGWTLDGWMDT